MYVYLHVHVLHCYLHHTKCHHVLTMCEHYCVNMHLSITLLNTFYPSCPFTMYVYLHVHVLHCYLHHTKCHHVLTMCEHYCMNKHMSIIVFKYILPFISIYNVCLSTCTCTTVLLASYQVTPSVGNVYLQFIPFLSILTKIVHIVYFELVQESIDYTVDNDPIQKQVIRHILIILSRELNLFLERPVAGFKMFPAHPPTPHPTPYHHPHPATAPSECDISM